MDVTQSVSTSTPMRSPAVPPVILGENADFLQEKISGGS
jgi:hypothetical protein